MSELPRLSLPTRFESPLFFKILYDGTAELERVRMSHFPTSSAARFGSLPTGTIDAQAILPRDSKYPVVILNRDIFFFIWALSSSISNAIPVMYFPEIKAVGWDFSEKGIRDRLRAHPEIVAVFADQLSRIVGAGTAIGAIAVELDKDHKTIDYRLSNAIKTFVLGHELAHVILGHVSDKSVAFRLAGGGNQNRRAVPQASEPRKSNSREKSPPAKNRAGGPSITLRAQLRTRKQELEADALGFRLMMWTEETRTNTVQQMIAAATPHIVFRMMDAVDTYGQEARGTVFGDANHPPAADRVKALSPVVDELLKESQAALAELPPDDNHPVRHIEDIRNPLERALKVLLAEADSQIRQNLGLSARSSPSGGEFPIVLQYR
jgi:hypothetical protein